MLTPFVASLVLGISSPAISPNTIQKHLEFLCSDQAEGRLTLSKGSELIAAYGAKEFKKYGLEEGPNKGYLHYFDYQLSQRATAKNVASFQNDSGKRVSLKLGKDFVPLIGTTNLKTIDGDIVYAGYGLDDEDWNDFKGEDLTGKVVLMLRGVPEGRSSRSNGAKARVAFEKGAVGVIFAGSLGAGHSPLPRMVRGQGIPNDLGVGIGIGDSAFEKIAGMKITDARAAKAPATKLLGMKAHLITETEPNTGKAINVIGYLPGHDPVLKNEYVIVGGHYDHLGWGEVGSRTGSDMLHRGADDNGSGAVGVLAVAEYLAKQKTNKRTIIFQLYTGEEEGLVGSNKWCQENPDILKNVTAMLNMDMIGSVRFNDIYVFGTSTCLGWDKILDTIKVPDLNLVYRPHLRGDSDQASFGRRNIPALFFHSMLTQTYHTEKDTLDTINFKGAAAVCDAVAAMALAVDKLPKLEWNPEAKLGGRQDDRVIPTGPGTSERVGK